MRSRSGRKVKTSCILRRSYVRMFVCCWFVSSACMCRGLTHGLLHYYWLWWTHKCILNVPFIVRNNKSVYIYKWLMFYFSRIFTFFFFFLFKIARGLYCQIVPVFKSYFYHRSTEHFVFILYSGRNNTAGNNVFISWCWKRGSSRVGLGPEHQNTGQNVPCCRAGSIFRGQTSHRGALICGCCRTSLIAWLPLVMQ